MPPTNWTPLPIEDGGTGGTTPASARRALGLSKDITVTGLIKASGVQFTGLATATSGAGIEIRYDPSGAGTGAITPIDRTTGLQKALALDALSIVLEIAGLPAIQILGDKTINTFGPQLSAATLFKSPLLTTSVGVNLGFSTGGASARLTISTTGQFYPATEAGAAQTASGIFAGTGVPNNANGNNGDFYFRSDGGAGTCIYQRRAGAWVATGA